MRLFFGGLLVSNVGTWMQLTVMSLLVFRLTGESTSVSISIGLQFLPMLFLGAWAGSIADALDKRKMAIVTQSAMAAQAFAIGLLDVTGLINLPLVYAMSLALGVANAFDNPARRSLVTELVPPEEITNATSLNTAVMTSSRIVGPAIGAVLVGALGTGVCFLLNGATFSAIIFSLTALRTNEMYSSPPRPKGGQPVRDALRFIVGRRNLLVLFVVLLVVSTFAFNQQVVFPKLADLKWGGDQSFGYVLGVMSVGSLTGALLTARLRHVSLRWYFGNAVVLSVTAIGIAWAPNIWVAFLWAMPMGLGASGFITAANAIMQQESPSDMRGRLMALQAVVFLGSTPIGGPITGVIADQVSVEWALGYGSVISLLVVAAASVYWLATARRRAETALAR
ncbi:MAG: MFS transporter [Ilumatobacter sp.]|nr:MFS transporter [Ilumatobacter sp.]MBT7430492.1 MFS transporter [Ilumatobacter sp.]